MRRRPEVKAVVEGLDAAIAELFRISAREERVRIDDEVRAGRPLREDPPIELARRLAPRGREEELEVAHGATVIATTFMPCRRPAA